MATSQQAGGRVLVTGGAGFIGTTLARELADSAEQWVVLDNLHAEERLETDARQLLLEHAKAIKDSSADYRQLLGKVKEKLARERGFIL